MPDLNTKKPFTCVTCEAEILGSPTFRIGLPFCCSGCAAGGPCTCSYDLGVSDDARVRHCLDVADSVAVPTVAADGRDSRSARR